MEHPCVLDPHLAHAFQRDGHVTVRGLISAAEAAAIRPEIAAVVDAVTAARDPQGRLDDYGELFTQVTNAWRLSERVRAFVFARRFARVAAELMGVSGVRLYHDQALVKEPGGRPTPWHQDQYYWPLDTGSTVTLWMPLAGDATFHSGRTVHAARANRSARRREVMTIIYFADGARVIEPDNEHRRADLDVFLPGLSGGDLAASPLNPVLYSL